MSLRGYLNDQGITKEETIARTPQPTGVAERMMRTIKEAARTMLIDAEMPEGFWGLAAVWAMWLRNRLPTQSLSSRKTPYEELFGEKPSLRDAMPFGATCFIHIPKEDRRGGGLRTPHGRKGRVVGRSETSKGWKILLEGRGNQVIESRDVKFWEELPENPSIPLSSESPAKDRRPRRSSSRDSEDSYSTDTDSDQDEEEVAKTLGRSRTSINKSGEEDEDEDDDESDNSAMSRRPVFHDKETWEEEHEGSDWDTDDDKKMSDYDQYVGARVEKIKSWNAKYPVQDRHKDKKGTWAQKPIEEIRARVKEKIETLVQKPQDPQPPEPEITVTPAEPESSGRPKRQTKLPGHLGDYEIHLVRKKNRTGKS